MKCTKHALYAVIKHKRKIKTSCFVDFELSDVELDELFCCELLLSDSESDWPCPAASDRHYNGSARSSWSDLCPSRGT